VIPISRPTIEDIDVRTVSDAVASGWVSSLGSYIDEFERRFAEFCGVRHCVTVTNGTVAIHLALEVLGIGPGDEVIVPDLTFVATANMVALAGAKPVIADVRASDWCLDPGAVERAITPRTRAIIPVHLYGHPAAMDELNAIAHAHGLKVIEDAAEAHGATYRGRRVGGLGDCATFSFYGNKIITTGEGGALTTDSDEIAGRARFLRDHAMSKERRYWHSEIGYNYRMTNPQAALGVAQLGRIDDFISERDRILETYRHYLASEPLTLNPRLEDSRPVNWITCVLLNGADRQQRDRTLERLKTQGIDTRPFFYPLSALPMYASAPTTVSTGLSARGLNLPTYPGLSEEEIRTVSDAVSKAIRCMTSSDRTAG
jgi:perosamine synthetase